MRTCVFVCSLCLCVAVVNLIVITCPLCALSVCQGVDPCDVCFVLWFGLMVRLAIGVVMDRFCSQFCHIVITDCNTTVFHTVIMSVNRE